MKAKNDQIWIKINSKTRFPDKNAQRARAPTQDHAHIYYFAKWPTNPQWGLFQVLQHVDICVGVYLRNFDYFLGWNPLRKRLVDVSLCDVLRICFAAFVHFPVSATGGPGRPENAQTLQNICATRRTTKRRPIVFATDSTPESNQNYANIPLRKCLRSGIPSGGQTTEVSRAPRIILLVFGKFTKMSENRFVTTEPPRAS